MWRPQHNRFKTVNLCNQFLVKYINKKKQDLEKIGLERKAMAYHTATLSIQKYPLPIICQQQLKSLYGVGELLCEELLTVIKHHYQHFLKETPTINTNPDLISQSQATFLEEDDQSWNESRTTSFKELPKHKKQSMQSQEGLENEEDSKSSYSFKSVNIDKPYKPRPKTQGAYVLSILWKCGEGDFFSRQQILEQLRVTYNTKLTNKALILILSNLTKSGYIERDSVNFSMVRLTPKGRKENQMLEAKTKEKNSSLKVKNLVNSFLSNKDPQIKSTQSLTSKHLKSIVWREEEEEVCLLIDSREIKDKQEQTFFEKKITEKYGVKTRTTNLPIGDFMWEYQGQILDYVVERKKADDLISSIFDGRYKQQKYRLKNSGFANIYYLYEGHLTGNFAKNERVVASALLNTRIRDSFKVVQVNNITESAKFLHFVTNKIQKKIEEDKTIHSLGTIEEVTALNGKASQLTVENIFGLSLKTIPGVGKIAVNEVLKHFRTFRELYTKLSQLQNRFERVEFLRELLRGGGVRGNVGEALVGMLFGE